MASHVCHCPCPDAVVPTSSPPRRQHRCRPPTPTLARTPPCRLPVVPAGGLLPRRPKLQGGAGGARVRRGHRHRGRHPTGVGVRDAASACAPLWALPGASAARSMHRRAQSCATHFSAQRAVALNAGAAACRRSPRVATCQWSQREARRSQRQRTGVCAACRVAERAKASLPRLTTAPVHPVMAASQRRRAPVPARSCAPCGTCSARSRWCT